MTERGSGGQSPRLKGGSTGFLSGWWAKPSEFQPRPAGTRRMGNRPGTIRNPLFQKFAADFFGAAAASGGSLTHNQNDASKGALKDALAILRPCLPDGFVPVALPLSTLKNIKAKSAKRR